MSNNGKGRNYANEPKHDVSEAHLTCKGRACKLAGNFKDMKYSFYSLIQGT